MANQNYDQLEGLIANGFNWQTKSVYALLYSEAVFDPAHTKASDLGDISARLKRVPLQGRFITEDGDFAGLPAVFYMVAPDTAYQVILGYDDGRHDDLLLGFYDENTDGTPITVQRRGAMFVRPAQVEEDGTPTYNIWLRPEQA